MIKIDQLSKSFGSKVVLDSVNYHFPESEKIALVGPNGAGKTTLLNILTGEEESDKGVLIKPGRLRLAYLPQEPNQSPESTCMEEVLAGGQGFMQTLYRKHRDALKEMTDNYSDRTFKTFEVLDEQFKAEEGYALESLASSVLDGLGFSVAMTNKSPLELSGGWRMRLELAKIFVSRPNFLILDEPTNHLDLPSLAWVERWLMAFNGTLLFVSHDRSLLERLPTLTLHLHGGQLTPYRGNFSAFLEAKAMKDELNASTAESLRRQREHLQSFVDRFGAKATKAKQAQSRVKMISRIRDLEGELPTEDSVDSMALQINLSQKSGREVLKISGLSFGYGEPLAKDIDLLVERGHKIAVIGANGIGKSTFLKTIAGHLQALAGTAVQGHNVQMAWFAQDQLDTLEPQKSVLENAMAASHTTTERSTRAVLGALLFRGEDVFKKVEVLSGGEKARVGLARLLSQEANLLLLDEPTNHLDISSNEILTAALQDYEGTILFVSHDRDFIDAVCSHVFVMLPDGRHQLFIGKLDDYQAAADKTGFPNVLAPVVEQSQKAQRSKSSSKGQNQTQKERDPSDQTSGSSYAESEIVQMKKDLQKGLRKLDDINQRISSTQTSLDNVMRDMELCATDFSKMAALEQSRAGFDQTMADLEEEWLELSHRIESLEKILKDLGRY